MQEEALQGADVTVWWTSRPSGLRDYEPLLLGGATKAILWLWQRGDTLTW